MLNPDLRNLLKDKTSRYSLVIATAKRARQITEEAEGIEADRVILEEKAVSLATEELLSGKYVIVEPDEIKGL